MEKKVIGIGVAIGILLIILAVVGNYFTGNVVSDKGDNPQIIFYKTLRASINYEYSETCYPSGEVMEIILGNECCEGLMPISIIDEAEEDCVFVSGVGLCTNCGNSLCEYGENKCNCDEDCD